MLIVAKVTIVAVLGLVCVFIGDPLVRWIFHLAGDATRPAAPNSESPQDSGSAIEQAAQTLRGGRVIGWLERLSTYACILTKFAPGIAIIVAVKGLARYPDLKSSDGTAERFIIGTFASLLIASAGAGLTLWLVGLF